MSLSIAKRFMKQFDAQQAVGVKLKKSKKPKQKSPVQNKETKIEKLLLLTSSLDDQLCKNVSEDEFGSNFKSNNLTVALTKCNKIQTSKFNAWEEAK